MLQTENDKKDIEINNLTYHLTEWKEKYMKIELKQKELQEEVVTREKQIHQVKMKKKKKKMARLSETLSYCSSHHLSLCRIMLFDCI